jgi:RHS repeat-associated protein
MRGFYAVRYRRKNVILRRKTSGVSGQLAKLALFAATVSASASMITVSVSGQFGSGVTADQLAAPGELWAISFDVASNPVAANTDAFSFDAPFSDFSYLLNGSAVAVSPQSIRFYESGDGGLFTLFFGPETGFINGMPIPEFSFSGNQVFSGTPGSPTILLGSYPVGDVTYSDAINFDDEGASGTVTIAAPQSTVPEPSTFWLILTGVALTLFARVRDFRAGKGVSAGVILCTRPRPSDYGAERRTCQPIACAPSPASMHMRRHFPSIAKMALDVSQIGHLRASKERIIRAFILVAFLLTIAASVKAQSTFNATGYWTGPRLEAGFLPASLQITLVQDASGAVVGTVFLQDTDDPSYYALMSATGTVSGGLLSFQDTAFLINIPPLGAVWCLRSGTLSISADGTNLSGTMVGTGDCDNQATYDVTRTDISGLQSGDPLDVPGGTSGICPCQTDPISIGSGNVFEKFADYTTAGANPIAFIRYYNSMPVWATNAVSLGARWRSTYDRYLTVNSGTLATAERGDGQIVTFTLSGGKWSPSTFINLSLVQSGSTWTLTDGNETQETYQGTAGLLLVDSIKARGGYTQNLAHNGKNQLASITDSYGRTLGFTYGSNGLLESVSTPDSTSIAYAYTSVGGSSILSSVSYSTTPVSTVTYLYQNVAFPFALTGVIDENGNRYQTWTYDALGRALSSQQGTGATANITQVAYDDTTGFRTITNALGLKEAYKFAPINGGVPTLLEIDRAASGASASAKQAYTYDANGYVSSITDWNGNHTTYVNDAQGDPTTIKEAVGTAVARTTTITYNTTFVHLPAQTVTTGLTTSYTYDSSGELLTRTLTDTTSQIAPYSTHGQTRTWTNTWLNFLLASAETPNGNTTSFSYDASGALIKTTNALGQATSITAHTGGGLPLTVVDPNGVITALSYDARQRLLTSTIGTAAGPLTTTNTYDAAGNLIKTTLPDGSALTNTYDTAHRLTTITDLFHQNVAYALDALGDRTKTNLTAVGNRIQRQHSDNFDALGRVLQDIGGVGQTTGYAYDPNGNVLTITDPLSRVTQRAFDALNRLSSVTDPNSGITRTTYDAHDRVLSVTDANGNATTYVYDGFGDLIQQLSPDSGKTVYHYDADGNLTQKTDAAGNVTNNTYDALDRVLTTSYPADATLNVSFTYDQAGHGFGIGRLTSLSDAPGTLSRSYDERGNMLSETRVVGTTTLTTAYAYDAASRVASITYPSAWTVSQNRDIMGRIWQLPVTTPASTHAGNAITNATYKPFGPLYALTYGNGVNEARTFDLDYRVTALADAGATAVQGLTYGYDAADNVLSIADAVTPGNSQSFGYDVLKRLISATGAYGSLGYTYDKVGNRLTQTLGAAITTYAYTSGTNRLASITATGITKPVSYTATGNISSIPPTPGAAVATLTYSAANRLKSETGMAVAIAGIVYDAFGKRITKAEPGSNPLLFTYDQSGNLLEETDGRGTLIDYIYLNGRPVSEITGGKVYYLHSDRLGTPQLATDANQNVAWDTMYQPFGTTAIPVGSISQNLRFPGQYADGETGFSYNVNRDYIPSIGRYLESDPIGLAGGINAYGYAMENPIARIDPQGTVCLPPLPTLPPLPGFPQPPVDVPVGPVTPLPTGPKPSDGGGGKPGPSLPPL